MYLGLKNEPPFRNIYLISRAIITNRHSRLCIYTVCAHRAGYIYRPTGNSNLTRMNYLALALHFSFGWTGFVSSCLGGYLESAFKSYLKCFLFTIERKSSVRLVIPTRQRALVFFSSKSMKIYFLSSRLASYSGGYTLSRPLRKIHASLFRDNMRLFNEALCCFLHSTSLFLGQAGGPFDSHITRSSNIYG